MIGVTDAWQWDLSQITRSSWNLILIYPPKNGDSWFAPWKIRFVRPYLAIFQLLLSDADRLKR